MSFTLQDVDSAMENEQFETFSQWRADHYKSDGWSSIEENDWYELSSGTGRVTLNDAEYQWSSVEFIGGEGQGEYTAVIFEIDGRLFRKEGYYASHYGADWDGDLEEVEAYEKTVTDYRTVS